VARVYITCVVCCPSELSAASRQRVLRSRHALPAVTGAVAESPA